MESQDLDRIRFVTRHYGDLKGLHTLVPMGSMYLGLGLCSLLPQPAALIALIALMPVLAAAMPFLTLRSNAYYKKRFGEAQPTRNRYGLAFSLLAILTLLPLCYLWYRGVRFRDRDLVDRVLYTFAGSALLWHWLWKECRASQLYHLVLGALLLGFAMPVHSPSGFLLPQLGKSGMGYLLAGLAWCMAGLLDHWQLVRTLGPHHEEEALAGC